MKTSKFKGLLTICLLLPAASWLRAEPWIDTRDAWIRADIEMLSDAGIIKVPITTYPLMWSGIIRDIDNTDIRDLSIQYKALFWRVKKLGKAAMANHATRRLRLSAATSEQILRSFGSGTRTEAEISARSSNMDKEFAWNIEVSRVSNPQDGENIRYDGSYIAGVWGNWIASFGAVEKWWGPSWDSANLLSNNARPPVGITIQRNYSDQSDNLTLKWLGPWTFNGFIAELNDTRSITDRQLTGLSFNFKPHQSLELALRVTALWGGEGKSKSLSSFVDNIIADPSCLSNIDVDTMASICDAYYSDNGDRRAGIDIRWRLPLAGLISKSPISVYASRYGESESQFLPSKNINQYGLTSSFVALNTNWKWFAETVDTNLNGELFNQAYENLDRPGGIYQTGYRYFQRVIGSTYDNDSKVTSFGLMTSLNRQNRFSAVLSNLKLNQDGQNASLIALHTISSSAKEFKRIQLNWSYFTQRIGKFELSVSYVDKLFDETERTDEPYRLALNWSYIL